MFSNMNHKISNTDVMNEDKQTKIDLGCLSNESGEFVGEFRFKICTSINKKI